MRLKKQIMPAISLALCLLLGQQLFAVSPAAEEKTFSEIIVLPDASLSVEPSTICEGDSHDLIFKICDGASPFDIDYTITDASGSETKTFIDVNNLDFLSFSPPMDVTYEIVSITDANGDTRSTGFSASATASVAVTPLPDASLGVPASVCAGEPFDLLFNLCEGTAPFKVTYTITDEDGSRTATTPPISNGYTEPFSLLNNTTFEITSVTDANGCTRTSGFSSHATKTVTVVATPEPDFTVEEICFGSATIFTANQSGESYEWDFDGDGEIDSTEGTANYTYEQTGTFSVTLKAINSQGCFKAVTKEVTIGFYPVIDAGNDTTIYQGDSFTIPAMAEGGESYQWSPEVGLDDPALLNPVAQPEETTTYTLTVTSTEGCESVDEITITVEEAQIIVYNAFTPDNDNNNDYWIIDGIKGFPDNKVEVYDRWGNQLFRSLGYEQPWKGTNGGSELPAGTYYYVIDLKNGQGPQKGTVTIIR